MSVGKSAAYRLYVRSVCDTKDPLQLPLVAPYSLSVICLNVCLTVFSEMFYNTALCSRANNNSNSGYR